MNAVTITFSLIIWLIVGPPLTANAEPYVIEIDQVSDWRPVFGEVSSIKRARARARLTGTLTSLDVAEGDTVAAGEVVAQVEDEKIPLQIAAVDARLKALDAEASQAEIDLRRAEELRTRGTIPEASLDQARTRREIVEQNRAATHAERLALKARQAEGDVFAPETGRVLSVPVVEGMPVQPGETVAVIATEPFILRAKLPERHARFLGAGETVRIAERGALSGGGTARDGKIIKVYPELEAGQVVVDIEASGLGNFFIGERIRLDVATGQRSVIIVPDSYLDLRHGVTFVRLENGNEVVVQPGVRSDDGVEILAGLKAGDRLIAYREAER